MSEKSKKYSKGKMPLRLRIRLIFLWRGYTPEECEKILEEIATKITNQKARRVRHVDYLLAKMEFTYYAYRIRNLKYNNDSVDETDGVASGVLEKFRNCLKDIVLAPKVSGDNKKTAINILLGQHSNETLYQIARNDASLSLSLDKDGKLLIAPYILKNFPKNCDHNLINMAFYWVAHGRSELVNMAIDKIVSPKSLLTLCLFFRDNKHNIGCTGKAINRIGEIIIDCNSKLVEQGVVYDKLDCSNEKDWLENHELSLLYSAHTALEKIIVTYADPNSADLKEADLQREQDLIQSAIDKMIIGGFLQKIISSNTDTVKQSKCEERLKQINKEVITEQMYRDRLLFANCSEKEQIEAIKELDFTTPDNRGLASKLAERLENNKNGVQYTPKLKDSVGYAFCEKLYGSHYFMPNERNNGIEVCVHCGARKTIDYIVSGAIEPPRVTESPANSDDVNSSNN